MNDHSVDYDFTPSSTSTLKSLFENARENPDNSSLTYTAPKQPKTSGTLAEATSEAPKVETSVICAKVVQVWKLVEGKYVAIGRHGCAVIGSSSHASYEMILYKEKTNVIMRAKVSPDFEFSLKKDDFASFYDSKDNWLIKFNNKEDSAVIVNTIQKYGGQIIELEPIPVTDKSKDSEKSLDVPDNKARADILSRIAKMGQSILPNKNVDSEDEISNASDNSVQHESSSKSFQNVAQEMPSQTLTCRPINTKEILQQNSNFEQTSTHFPHMPSTIVMSHPMDPMGLYVAENRVQGSEIRMNLSQISEKLNSIMQLVDNGRHSNENHEALKSKLKVLQLRNENLVKELTSLQEENKNLKKEESYNAILKLEQTRLELELRKKQEAASIEELQQQIKMHENKNEELRKIVGSQTDEIEEIRSKLSLQEKDREWHSEALRLEQIVADLEKRQQENDENCAKHIQKETNAHVIAMLKEEMNGMYAAISANIKESDISEINSIIAQSIKSTTLKIIQSFQQIYDSQENN